MSSISILPRVLVHRTRWGTTIVFDRRQGLLARDEGAGAWRAISAEELRRGYPEAFAAWLRLATLLPAGAASAGASHSGGGDHAA